ncbi:FAD-dependent oxidoreductase [Vallitalea pronyensis]|uniref:FAD-dependent oxidoreductase n=1 Tax=Vallitalea pronyensis TaxID=1348613 RepID=A0A8J8SIU5_9FIRM|nr:FAD-dependent oxidoreductase [Vallitalea pronyensis]QUI25300.1 FAD-dependent oxidoreductase [Vallitalea pronyensis]
MRIKLKTITSDLTIAGAGMPGICAAIQAARSGLKVALINNRGFLGGNASPEIRIDICGADGACEFNFYARETGIIEEIRLENLYRNPQGNPYLWHTVLLDFVLKEENISLFLNTNIDEVHTTSDHLITSIEGSQSGSEKRFKFESPLFMDNTGDGTVGYLAGAEFRMGREGKDEFNERIAPDEPDDKTLLSTLSFYSVDTTRPAPFTRPNFAQDVPIEDALNYRQIPDRNPHSTRFEHYRMQWFYETGHEHHPVNGAEAIMHQHRQLVWGIWDHIKNSGQYDASRHDITYMSPIPGKRESRRFVGDYILNENDIVQQHAFDDTIGYGGWSIDLHAMEGFFSTDIMTNHYVLEGVYAIPYRSCFSVNVPNLLLAGRCMSTTHVAFGSTRVMATLGVLGQSLGIAASLMHTYHMTPRALSEERLHELKQELLHNDLCFFDNKNQDTSDLAKQATIQVSSTQATENMAMTHSKSLDEPIGLILPVASHLECLNLYVKAHEDTALVYEIWTPNKKENYSPKACIKQSSMHLTADDTFRWISLPADCATSAGKVMIKLIPNPKLSLGFNHEKMNGIITLIQKPLPEHTTFTSIETHHIRRSLWVKSQDTLCFQYDDPTNIYGPKSLINGYSRNYRLPNLWLSRPSKEAWINMTFDEPKVIRQMTLTFDSDLNFFYDNLEIHYDFNAIPELVKDYQVIASYEGSDQVIATVEGNYQRVNHLTFDGVTADTINIKMTATNGSTRFGVYEVNVY